MHACRGGHGIPVGFCWGEVDGGDGGVFLDEDWVLVLSPVARLGVVFGRSRARVLANDNWLVVHDDADEEGGQLARPG